MTSAARLNPRTPFNPAAIDNPYDYNRDRLVNSADQVIPRYNATTPWTMLKLITAPAVVTTDDAAATDKATAVAIAVLSNDRNVGGALSVSRVDAASSLGASLSINADQTIRYDPRFRRPCRRCWPANRCGTRLPTRSRTTRGLPTRRR